MFNEQGRRLDMAVGNASSIHAMNYVFYCDRSAILRGLPCNAGIEEALKGIEDLRRHGVKVRIVDTAQISTDELQTAYMGIITPSVMKKYPIRQIFGSRRQSGFMFGRGVPALVVYGPSSTVQEDVFPHEESGRIVTINEILSRLSAI